MIYMTSKEYYKELERVLNEGSKEEVLNFFDNYYTVFIDPSFRDLRNTYNH